MSKDEDPFYLFGKRLGKKAEDVGRWLGDFSEPIDTEGVDMKRPRLVEEVGPDGKVKVPPDLAGPGDDVLVIKLERSEDGD